MKHSYSTGQWQYPMYNALGRRVEDYQGTGTDSLRLTYPIDIFGQRTETWAQWPSQNWTGWNVYWSQVAGQRLNMGGTSSYVDHADAVGTTTMETDQTGAVVWDSQNYPWGRVWQQTGSRSSWVFAGLDWQVNDPSYPSATREYDQRLGRWMTPDPLGMAAADPSNPQSWNRYAYVTNNPTTLTGPLGLLGPTTVGCDPGAVCVTSLQVADPIPVTSWAAAELDPILELALYGLWRGPSTMWHPQLPRPNSGPLSVAANNGMPPQPSQSSERLERLKNWALAYYGIDPLSATGLASDVSKWLLAGGPGVPKAAAEAVGMRVIAPDGASSFTSLARTGSILSGGALQPVAVFAKRFGGPIAIASAVIDATAVGICTAMD